MDQDELLLLLLRGHCLMKCGVNVLDMGQIRRTDVQE